jgi:molybdopterin-guanine dinucleotide biosynthesis protein A
MPFVPAGLLRWLADLRQRVALVELDGRVQPLLGRYVPDVAPALLEAADRGDPAREAVLALGARVVGETELRRFGDPARIAFNVNRREDLGEAERLLESSNASPHGG